MCEYNQIPNNCNFRRWDEINPDVLALIFKHNSLEETLTVIPCVCKGWQSAIMGPSCWQEIDILEWSKNCRPEKVKKMLKMLIPRSSGSLHKLCVSELQNDRKLFFIAYHAKYLTTLQLSRSSISNSMMQGIAKHLFSIITLDISYCKNIRWSAIKSIGKHCKNLKVLLWNMTAQSIYNFYPKDSEGLVIASTMPNLIHLELANHMITTEAVVNILKSCKDLEVLDVSGCLMVKLDEDLLKTFQKVKVVKKCVMEYDDDDDDDDDDDWYSDKLSSRDVDYDGYLSP